MNSIFLLLYRQHRPPISSATVVKIPTPACLSALCFQLESNPPLSTLGSQRLICFAPAHVSCKSLVWRVKEVYFTPRLVHLNSQHSNSASATVQRLQEPYYLCFFLVLFRYHTHVKSIILALVEAQTVTTSRVTPSCWVLGGQFYHHITTRQALRNSECQGACMQQAGCGGTGTLILVECISVLCHFQIDDGETVQSMCCQNYDE